MEPLRVDFEFGGFVSVSDQSVHLDGLLAWAAVELARDRGEVDLDRAAATLPLSRRGEPKVWCASALQFDYLTPPQYRMLTRTTDVHDYAEGISSGRITTTKPRDQLPTGSGPLRNHLVSYTVRQAKSASAWCVGDPAEVRRLLKEIKYVGRYGRMGYGEVRSIDVVPDPAAKKNWKLRHLPWREEGYVAIIGNYEAPYWKKTTMSEVYAPPSMPIASAPAA